VPIIHSGNNLKFKYEVQIKPGIERMAITNRWNVSRKVFNELKGEGIIQRNFGSHIFSRYHLNISTLETAAANPGYLSIIFKMGKIRVPSKLSFKNDFEAIVGSLCKDSRVVISKNDHDIDLTVYKNFSISPSTYY